VSEFGELSHRGRSLFLSQLDQRVAELLVEQFGAVIPESELRNQVWPEGATQQALRVHVSRLRRRIAPLGLTIISIRCKGYVMREIARDSESGSSSQPAVR
jgi:DNA-binding response OmpR family regulator